MLLLVVVLPINLLARDSCSYPVIYLITKQTACTKQHWINLQNSEKASDGAAASKKPKSASNGTAIDPSKKKDKKQGVQNDPTKSEVYKSLFDSHKSAQNKPKGNWVTFDPRYN